MHHLQRLICALTVLLALVPAAWAAEPAAPQPPAKVAFDNPTYDFELRRVLGYALSGGADLNEVLGAAHRVKAGDGDSWHQAWFDLAQRVRAMADQARGHRVSTREALLRASAYYRPADFFLHADPGDPRILESWKLSRDTFRQAARLMDHPVEVAAIPYENTTLPGYFMCPDDTRLPRKTLIVQTGFDGTGEELYFEVAFFALARGYNVLIFEGPGQGGVVREQHLYFRPDWEKVVTPVVDYALSRPEVDRQRLALMGISMGGYLVARAAAYEHRLAALVCNPGVMDMMAGKRPSEKQWQEMRSNPVAANHAMRQRMAQDIGFRWLVNNGMFTMGVRSPLEFMERFARYRLTREQARRITANSLVIASRGDHFMSYGDQKKLYNAMTCPKTLMEFTAAEDATPHCQMGAVAVSSQRIFDWLDKAVEQKPCPCGRR
ncbi:MAG: alpha/beta fold hydrolase [Desulfarculus sp.]|nr:alpha/beta fold hydrolase [Pseudomonadota bacterium]MBV1717408.1 alpha/beta fold hydrolase [Desulfarculus sp.]MBU4574191.1 alpha/beta fold hydrolase [Pseudomonadota bacterium]MBU4598707.1 alpha/beta fold hydrolase [Pseudomonadota bacterium]MBV1739978.1 alpha/beta fold hydrolase [Desulfarculus sp.]